MFVRSYVRFHFVLQCDHLGYRNSYGHMQYRASYHMTCEYGVKTIDLNSWCILPVWYMHFMWYLWEWEIIKHKVWVLCWFSPFYLWVSHQAIHQIWDKIALSVRVDRLSHIYRFYDADKLRHTELHFSVET